MVGCTGWQLLAVNFRLCSVIRNPNISGLRTTPWHSTMDLCRSKGLSCYTTKTISLCVFIWRFRGDHGEVGRCYFWVLYLTGAEVHAVWQTCLILYTHYAASDRRVQSYMALELRLLQAINVQVNYKSLRSDGVWPAAQPTARPLRQLGRSVQGPSYSLGRPDYPSPTQSSNASVERSANGIKRLCRIAAAANWSKSIAPVYTYIVCLDRSH